MSTVVTVSQFTLGITLGVLIACSPTKFTPSALTDSSCTAASACVYSNGFNVYTPTHTIGESKVDILFVNDNSASMSPIQIKLRERFAGFIQNLDSKRIDYRIAMTTTDLAQVSQKRLISFGNGKTVLTKADNDRVVLFNGAILRPETLNCESLIITYFNTFGSNFKFANGYNKLYLERCPSPDTRGIHTANLVVSENADSFMRTDANLNVILISNDEVRQGKFYTDSAYALGAKDTAASFQAMMQEKYPTKYWDFNSIVVMDPTCRAAQTLRNELGQEVMDQGGPAITGGIGEEYLKLSKSVAKSIDNGTRNRGLDLNICQDNYASNFSSMAAQISESSRQLQLNCAPKEAPVVTPANVPYTWVSDKIVFQRGSEGMQVNVSYRCYTGVQ